MGIQINQVIAGRYRVVELVGRGGMADVYKVWDNRRTTTLAMKVLRDDLAEDPVFMRRFQKEAQTLATLSHPNIVRFYGLEKEGTTAFMLMDFIDGTTLRREIAQRQQPFPVQQVLNYLGPVCSALNYAHQIGRIHCDVKPANIMIQSTGQVLLADFGIAHITDSTTTTMAGAGTPAYMAPEQILGQSPLPATDIYGLGIVLYEMLTGGYRPFTGERAQTSGSTGEKVRWEQLNLTPPPPSYYAPGTPAGLEAVVMRCLAKDPRARFATTMDVYKAACEAVGVGPAPILNPDEDQVPPQKPPETFPPDEGYATARKSTSPLVWIAGTALVLIVLFFIFGGNKPQAAPPLVPTVPQTSVAPVSVQNPSGNQPQSAPADTSTPWPTNPPVPAVAVQPTNIPYPTAIPPTPRPVMQISNFYACSSDCRADGSNSQDTFPEKITKIYLRWDFQNIPQGAHYRRTWTNGGRVWVQYDCIWPGPSNGTSITPITEPDGLASGTWEVTIDVDGQVLITKDIFISGSWTYFTPAGTSNKCFGFVK
jgi:serine/threonine protein kinase